MSNKIYLTPGPSQLYFSVEQHLKNALREDVASISHRSARFEEIFSSAVDKLKSLLNLPEGYQIVFTASATEVWERIALNLISKNCYHFVNGSFGEKFSEIAKKSDLNVTVNNPGFGQAFEVKEINRDIELISVTLNETSAGFQFEQNLLSTLRDRNPNALISLDVVSIAPAVPIDFSLVDTAYFSVQKSFGLPAGLGVWILNEKAIKKAEEVAASGKYVGSYHSVESLLKSASKNQTPETPNVLGIYLLGKVAGDMLTKGKEMMQRDTAYKAALLYQAIDENVHLSPFIDQKVNRSKTVCVAKVEGGNTWLLDSLSKKGFIVGKGYGSYKNDHIRIANFPTHSKEQIELFSDILKSSQPN